MCVCGSYVCLLMLFPYSRLYRLCRSENCCFPFRRTTNIWTFLDAHFPFSYFIHVCIYALCDSQKTLSQTQTASFVFCSVLISISRLEKDLPSENKETLYTQYLIFFSEIPKAIKERIIYFGV